MTGQRTRATDAPLAGTALAPGGDFELTPAVEAALDALARAGRDDPAARNELYAALGFKIARFLAPYRRRHAAAGEFADLEQDTFPIFAALVADWPETGSFARYFLGFFPWRLRHRVEAYERRWPLDRLAIVDTEDVPDPWDRFAMELDPATLVGPLDADERRLLAARVVEDRSLDEAAARFGWSRRTTFRRWRALRDRLAREVAEPRAEGEEASPGDERRVS